MDKNNQYPIYVQWIDTLDWILSSVEKYPHSVKFTIAGRISNYALDILDLIVEAIYTKDRKQLLQAINMNLEKLRVFYQLSFRRRYISQNQYHYVSQAINSVGIMVGGWAKVT